MANPDRQSRATDQRYPSNGRTYQDRTANPSQNATILSDLGRYPAPSHPYARLPSQRVPSQPKAASTNTSTRSALQPTSASQYVVNASTQPSQQRQSRDISHIHNPALEMDTVHVQTHRQLSSRHEREGHSAAPQPTLYKPKSKLRLRLKLTPPHPPGTKLLIPSAPLPKHLTKDDPSLLKVLTKITSIERKIEDKENHDEGRVTTRRDSITSFGNPSRASDFEQLDAIQPEYPPIHAQARAHQAYQRAQLGHGRVARPISNRSESRVPSDSTNDERAKAVAEAHTRRPAPSAPREPVFSTNRPIETQDQGSSTQEIDVGRIASIPQGHFYQLDPTPVVSPIRVEGPDFQTITAATPLTSRTRENGDRSLALDDPQAFPGDSGASTLDLSVTDSYADDSQTASDHVGNRTRAAEADDACYEMSYAEPHGEHGIEATFQKIPEPPSFNDGDHNDRVSRDRLPEAHTETRDLDEVRDSSFDNSGDTSNSRDEGETGWTSTSGDDSGMSADRDDEQQSSKRDGVRRKGPDTSEQMSDVLSLSDRMLASRFEFLQEIGFGNWGSVWAIKPRSAEYHPALRHEAGDHLSIADAVRSQHHREKIAVKLVHRRKETTTAARVRALWSEMKVIRTLRSDPHPSIIGFDSFIITPSYALVTMPFLSHLMPVGLQGAVARPYFLQLTSAIAYLHDHGITHNDIKPANILLSHNDTPVIVDFGFAQRWDLSNTDGRGPAKVSGLAVSSNKAGSTHVPFWSEISWGTPEYLDPLRAIGKWHDERLSDVWALGITFFEILIGRTPFEAHASEDFSTQDQLTVYYDRTLRGEWLGEWEMSTSMERLLKAMICPDYHKRLTASQAHRHVALQPQHKADHLSTPPFVRTATGLADHQAKRRREPQPKAKLPKRDHVRREAPPDARADGDPNCQFQSVQEVTERRSVTGIEHVTPRKKAPGHIIVITPTAEHTTDVANTEHNTEAIEGPKKRSKANQISGERPRVNAMTTMEGQRKPESINPSAVHDGLISATESSAETQEKEAANVPTGPRTAFVTIRRPASALGLRTADMPIAARPSNTFDFSAKSTSSSKRNTRETRSRTVSQHRRHTRIVSEGCLRAFTESKPGDLPTDLVVPVGPALPKAKAWENVKLHDIQQPEDAKVQARSTEEVISPLMIGSDTTMKGAGGAQIVDPITLDERLTEIASWVKSVEQIVFEARVALEEVQNPRCKTPIEFERSVSRLSNITNRRSVDNFLRLTREGRDAEDGPNDITAATVPTHRPSMSMETGPSYHLRRQRSDLTNFRSMQFQPIVEQELPESLPSNGAWSSSRVTFGLDRKLKSHRSTGDLNKLMQRSQDPYEDALASQTSVHKKGEGWSNARKGSAGLSLFGAKDEKGSKQADPHQGSRLKNFFRGILKR